MIRTKWGKTDVATVKKNTQVRYQGGVKSPVLAELKKKDLGIKKADKEEASNEYEKGEIKSQNPGKGKKVKKKFYGYGCDQQRRSCEKSNCAECCEQIGGGSRENASGCWSESDKRRGSL